MRNLPTPDFLHLLLTANKLSCITFSDGLWRVMLINKNKFMIQKVRTYTNTVCRVYDNR